jgi:hypothetical protein
MSFHSLECRTWRSGAGDAIQLHIQGNSSNNISRRIGLIGYKLRKRLSHGISTEAFSLRCRCSAFSASLVIGAATHGINSLPSNPRRHLKRFRHCTQIRARPSAELDQPLKTSIIRVCALEIETD